MEQAFGALLAARLPLRILLADDSVVNQKVGKCFLEKLGYRAEVVANGYEVLGVSSGNPTILFFSMCKCPRWTDTRQRGSSVGAGLAKIDLASWLSQVTPCRETGNYAWMITSPSLCALTICEPRSNAGVSLIEGLGP